MRYYEVKFIAKQYKNKKWTVWISRDGQKFMIGSDFTEEEFMTIIGRMKIEREHYTPKIDKEKEELKKKVDELEQYKIKFERLNKTLKGIVETNQSIL